MLQAHSFLHPFHQKSKCILKAYLGMISLKANALKKTIFGLVQAPLSYFKLCKEVYGKIGLRQLDCDECVSVKYSQNIKGQPPLTAENIIESGAFMTMDTVPEHQILRLPCRLYYRCYVCR
jgi:hypothetical protein